VFLSLTGKESLYGGAAGGGKSDAILMAALQYVDVPRYSALILRKSYADLSLPDAIMQRAKEWLMGKRGIRWNEGLKSFMFPTGDGNEPARLTFGFLEGENDKYRYQGSAYQFVGFDELTQFRESDYRYLFSRIRRPAEVAGPDDPLTRVPLRMRAASNPGGVGHEWVKQRFLIDGPANGRIFVPARLADNPSLDAVEYEKALDELDDVTRHQLLHGDWDVRQAGNIFKAGAFSTFIEPEDVSTAGFRMVRRWDLAATKPRKGHDPDYTVGTLMGRNLETGSVVIFDVKRTRDTPDVIESLVKATAAQDGRSVAIRMEQEPGSSGVSLISYYASKVVFGYDFDGVRTTGDKVANATPFATAANRGAIALVRAPWNSAFISECEAFPDGVHDDQVDSAGHAYMDIASLYQPGGATIQPATVRGRSPYRSERPPSLAGRRTR
jgi:predicted phage terminase large subunit-like protein